MEYPRKVKMSIYRKSQTGCWSVQGRKLLHCWSSEGWSEDTKRCLYNQISSLSAS